jgi:hypothetical protein
VESYGCIAPGGENKLLGKKVIRPLAAGQIIEATDVTP